MVKQAVCFAEFLSESVPFSSEKLFKGLILLMTKHIAFTQKRYWIVLYKARAKKNLVSVTVCNLMIA